MKFAELSALLVALAPACSSPAAPAPARSAPEAPRETAPSPATPAAEAYQRPGFETAFAGDELWVFRTQSPEFLAFREGRLPADAAELPRGPGGWTLRAPDSETLMSYSAARAGFEILVRDGRVWVLREGDPRLEELEREGELESFVVRPGLGPSGATLAAPDAETVAAYRAARPGFETRVRDGRVWVFRAGSALARSFDQDGEPTERVAWPGLGPDGSTLLAPDRATGLAYVAAREGFVTELKEDLLWVFRAGDPRQAAFQAGEEPSESVTRPAAGPAGLTVRAPDRETLEAYLAEVD